jgi:flagellar biosynthesis/type III secretory pathway protein FliH
LSDDLHAPQAAADWEPMHFDRTPNPDRGWAAACPAGSAPQSGFSVLYPPSEAACAASMPQEAPDQAPADAETLRREAYQEGLNRGQAEGFAAGMEKAAEVAENLHRLLTAAEQLWPALCRTYERQIIALVGRVAEKVVYGQVALDREVVRRTILKAFEQIPEPLTVALEVNPDDYEYLEALKKPLMDEISGLKQLSLQADPTVGRGGCRIETRSGTVDATLEARLEAIRQCLLETAPQPHTAVVEMPPADDRPGPDIAAPAAAVADDP